MFKVFGANVVVSKNFDDENPIRELSDGKIVTFRVADKKYDSRADDNTRWINVTAKASGDLATRIKKMKLKVGSTLIICGDLDIEKWENEDGDKKMDAVIWLTDINYQFTGNSEKSEGNNGKAKGESKPEKKGNDKKKQVEYEEYSDDEDDDEDLFD